MSELSNKVLFSAQKVVMEEAAAAQGAAEEAAAEQAAAEEAV